MGWGTVLDAGGAGHFPLLGGEQAEGVGELVGRHLHGCQITNIADITFRNFLFYLIG